MEVMGEHQIYPMYAAGKMKLKAAFKNACRALGLDFDEANEISKHFVTNFEYYIDTIYGHTGEESF